MRRIAPAVMFLCLVFGLQFGCASTRVKKNPGPHDHGVRYYRPKPYLMLQPGDEKNYVKMTIEYLPDWNEEYSIHVRAGIGTNKTEVVLEKGWNLTSINVDVDSKVSDFLTALSSLIPAVAKGAGVDGQKVVCPPSVTSCQFPVHNAPLGLYEAVILCGPDGTKKLCGWRYVGFAPYGGCNTNINCEVLGGESDLYGLIVVNGTACFSKLTDLKCLPPVPPEGLLAPDPSGSGKK